MAPVLHRAVLHRGPWLLGALALLLATPVDLAMAETSRDRCVYSADGVVLHQPNAVACGAAERRGKARGESNELEFATEIPPGNPFLPSDPHRRTGGGPVQPIEIGTRILYRKSLERSLYTEGLLARVIRYRGDRSEEMLAAAEGHGAARFEIRSSQRLSAEAGVPDIHETQRHYVVPNPTAYMLEASELAVAGQRRIARQPGGSEVLASDLRQGKKWPAGIHYVDGLAFEREGEVMGVQGIDSELGRFEKCLVVRYTSRLVRPGSSPTGDGARVTAGRLVTTEWFARGLGLVRSKQQGDLRLSDAHGTPGRLAFVSRSEIFQYQRLADRRDSDPLAAPDVGVEVRPDAGWTKGSWRLTHDPFVPVGAALPMDVMRFRPDGKVELAKRTRVYATCTYAVYGDALSVLCRDRRRRESHAFDLLINWDRSILTTAMGSQYTRK